MSFSKHLRDAIISVAALVEQLARFGVDLMDTHGRGHLDCRIFLIT
jgi:hypothetical protein